MRTHDHDQPGLADPARPEHAITEAAAACSNWGRWGDDDVRGTLNFLTDDKRVEGAGLVRRGPGTVEYEIDLTCARVRADEESA